MKNTGANRFGRQVVALGLVFAVFTSFAIGLQAWSGAFEADLAGDPDEAAHAVTALMVRDYLAEGLGQSPLGFANLYYESFPKVALGHYPPVYYGLASLPLLAWTSPTALLVLQAALFGILMALIWATTKDRLTYAGAATACVITAISPISQDLCIWVMSDLLLMVLCTTSILVWLSYLNSPSLGRSLLFGALAGLAMLTKGSALFLALLPPVSIALLGMWQELKTWRWWAAAAPVLLLAGPWFFLSLRITSEGMSHLGFSEFLPAALQYYGRELPAATGWPVLLAVAALVVLKALSASRRQPLSAIEAVAIAWALGGAAIVLLVPAGMSARYLFPILPPLAILAVRGVRMLTSRRPGLQLPALAALAVGCAAQFGTPDLKAESGFGIAVTKMMEAREGATQGRWLVSSDPRGEGAVIAAAAFALPSRAPSPLTVLRTSKELTNTDWMGRAYQAGFEGTKELAAHLRDRGIDLVFFDESLPSKWQKAHHQLLGQTLEAESDEWGVVLTQPIQRRAGQEGTMTVYRRLRAAGSEEPRS
jgi:4-amino-4-deoxy-L-arabinose transferase-like glycosyltransferase